MENFINKLKNVAGKAAKKSGELVELSKINLGIVGTKSEISTQFKVLGELVYAAQKNADDASTEKIEEIIANIDALYEKLNDLSEVNAALKNEKVCANCGKSNPENQAFCGGCGQKFDEEDDIAQEGEVIDDIANAETVS